MMQLRISDAGFYLLQILAFLLFCHWIIIWNEYDMVSIKEQRHFGGSIYDKLFHEYKMLLKIYFQMAT